VTVTSFAHLSLRPVRPAALRGALRPLLLACCLAAAGSAGAQSAAAAAQPASAASGPSLSAEVHKPLVAAQEALKAGKPQDALARLAEAEALPKLSDYERYIILRLKGPAAANGGDPALALATFEQVIKSPLLPPAEKPPIVEVTIKLALQQKKYELGASLMKAYLAEGGKSAEVERLYPQVLSLLGDHAAVVRLVQPVVAADAAAGRTTPEATLRLLAGSQLELKDMAGYLVAVEKLSASTGKAEYWAELISRTTRREGYADERLRIDLYRLRRAVGLVQEAGEVGDWAYRAQQAGLPAEAQKLMDEGFANGVLGKDANADADRKLRDGVTKSAAQDRAQITEAEASALKAKEGNAAVNLGLALSGAGQHERALALMAQGMAKGGLRRADDALLHLGYAQWRAGKIDEAKASFAQVKGSDGTADLARLWLVYLNSPARK
jgi:Tfp pilus assembly protein PilF